MNASQFSRSMLVSKPDRVAQCESANTFARSESREAHVPLKRFELSGRYFQNPLRRIGSAISGLCPDSDNPDKPLFFGNSTVGSTVGVINQHEVRFLTRPRAPAGALIETLCCFQRITDGVAARSPGKASSYLSAMKGEARRRRRMPGSKETRAAPDREGCRLHQGNKVRST